MQPYRRECLLIFSSLQDSEDIIGGFPDFEGEEQIFSPNTDGGML